MRIRLALLLSICTLWMAVDISQAHAHKHFRQASLITAHVHKHHFARAPHTSFAALPLEQAFDTDLDHSPHVTSTFFSSVCLPSPAFTRLKLMQPVYASKQTFDASVQLLL